MIQQTASTRRKPTLHRVLGDYYRALAGRLRQAAVAKESGLTSVGITSTKLGEGVTTASLNLGVIEANDFGRRVLLIDAHPRQPKLSRCFGFEKKKGLIDVSSGEESLENVALPSGVAPELFVLPAGRKESGQRDELAPNFVSELLLEAEDQFDFVLCDLPPAKVGSGCLEWASRLEGVVLMIEAERVKAATARNSISLLTDAGANVLGVVLNRDPAVQPNLRRRPR